MSKVTSLERRFQKRAGLAPKIEVSDSPAVSREALTDADSEAIRFLQDAALRVEYGDFARRGMRLQNFLRTRQLAFQDIFEDIPESLKVEMLRSQEITTEEIRSQPEYEEICDLLKRAVENLARGETPHEWLAAVAGRNRRNLERFSRTANPELLAHAARASAEILERELPKESRNKKDAIQIGISEKGVNQIVRGFLAAGFDMKDILGEEPKNVTPKAEELGD